MVLYIHVQLAIRKAGHCANVQRLKAGWQGIELGAGVATHGLKVVNLLMLKARKVLGTGNKFCPRQHSIY